eukprot:Hpha_TRINITY_DN19745_c0_g1::TRINITY_DN19745_c0_g1_i1::g.21842::m.21842
MSLVPTVEGNWIDGAETRFRVTLLSGERYLVTVPGMLEKGTPAQFRNDFLLDKGETIRCFWEIVDRRIFRIRFAAVCRYCLNPQDTSMEDKQGNVVRTPRCQVNESCRHREPLVTSDGRWVTPERIVIRHPRIQCKESAGQEEGDTGTLRTRYIGPFQSYFTTGGTGAFSFRNGNLAMGMPSELKEEPYVCCRSRVPLAAVTESLRSLQLTGNDRPPFARPFAVDSLRPAFIERLRTAAAPPVRDQDISRSLSACQRTALSALVRAVNFDNITRTRRVEQDGSSDSNDEMGTANDTSPRAVSYLFKSP